MEILGERERTQVTEMLQKLAGQVAIHVATSEGCETCQEVVQLVSEVAELSAKVDVTTFDLGTAKAAELRIDRAPAIAILGARDYGVRYYGLPTGYEFGAFVQDLIDISAGSTDLKDKPKANLDKLDKPAHIQVFTTPTCPVCPNMVRSAHKLAIESDWVSADAVDSVEFQDLAAKYGVQSVPRTIINESFQIEGVIPEGKLVAEIAKL
jgi:glutaredoxin-like protein